MMKLNNRLSSLRATLSWLVVGAVLWTFGAFAQDTISGLPKGPDDPSGKNTSESVSGLPDVGDGSKPSELPTFSNPFSKKDTTTKAATTKAATPTTAGK